MRRCPGHGVRLRSSGGVLRLEVGEPVQDFVAGAFGVLEGVEVAARDPTEMRSDQLACAAQATPPQFARVGAGDEGQGALVWVLSKGSQQAVGHGAVDGRFDFSLVAQPIGGGRRQGFQPMGQIVLQNPGMEGCEFGLDAEMLLGRLEAGPFVGALGCDTGWHDAVNEVDALDQTHGGAAPALQDGGVQDHHALSPLGILTGQHETEVATQGVPDEVGGLTDFLAQEIMQLGDEVGPVEGDRVARVVSELLDGVDGVALVPPTLEECLIGARREAVGVREDDGAMEGGLSHEVVAFGRHGRDVIPVGGKRYFQARRLV